MNESYWTGRWQRGETGWHQTAPEPLLAERFGALAPTRVLVPLCGKSLDLIWLASRGHEVVGIELSPLACETFFSENKLAVVRDDARGHPVYRTEAGVPGGGSITIHNLNIFETTCAMIGTVGAVYDRAALIALPPELRARYAEQVALLTHAGAQSKDFSFLVIVLERAPADEKGPPFSVSRGELERLYGARFRVRPLGRERVAMGESTSLTEECVYELETQLS